MQRLDVRRLRGRSGHIRESGPLDGSESERAGQPHRKIRPGYGKVRGEAALGVRFDDAYCCKQFQCFQIISLIRHITVACQRR